MDNDGLKMIDKKSFTSRLLNAIYFIRCIA